MFLIFIRINDLAGNMTASNSPTNLNLKKYQILFESGVTKLVRGRYKIIISDYILC